MMVRGAPAREGSRNDIQRPLNGEIRTGSSPASRISDAGTGTRRGLAPSRSASSLSSSPRVGVSSWARL